MAFKNSKKTVVSTACMDYMDYWHEVVKQWLQSSFNS
jgi:hypothetical protein